MGGDGSVKGRGIVRVPTGLVLRRCIDEEWMKVHLPDANVLDCNYHFDTGSFAFLVESEHIPIVPDGNVLPVLIAKPSLGRPPEHIVQNAVDARTMSIILWLREHSFDVVANVVSEEFVGRR